MADPKRHILCLHGFGQSAAVLEHKLQGLVRGANVVCHYVDGSVRLPDSPDGTPRYAWWTTSETTPLEIAWDKVDVTMYGLEASRKKVVDYCATLPRLDGVLGFSQGAAFADYLLRSGALMNMRCAIFISGFVWECKTHAPLGPAPALRSLHIYGHRDTVIPRAASVGLFDVYGHEDEEGLQELTMQMKHPGYHVVPGHADARANFRTVIDFKL